MAGETDTRSCDHTAGPGSEQLARHHHHNHYHHHHCHHHSHYHHHHRHHHNFSQQQLQPATWQSCGSGSAVSSPGSPQFSSGPCRFAAAFTFNFDGSPSPLDYVIQRAAFGCPS
jgi:hypothetical protein